MKVKKMGIEKRNNIDDEHKSILDHVNDLRSRIFISLGALFVAASVAHVYNKEIVEFILMPIGGEELIFLSPLDPFFFILKINLFVGFLAAFPIISLCMLTFIRPALGSKRTLLISMAYVSSAVLVAVAAVYAYYLVVPLTLKFLLSIDVPGVSTMITAQSYLNFFLIQALILALAFQIPLLVLAAVAMKVVKVETLSSKRRQIYVGGIIAFAFITPTSDLISLGTVILPAFILFELSLIVARIIARKTG